MTNLIIEEKETELFDYLNGLLVKHIYPYSNQVSGHYQAKELHERISSSFQKMAKEYITNKDEGIIDETSYQICQDIDEDISNFFHQKCEGNFYFIDFKIFQPNVSAKIKKLLA